MLAKKLNLFLLSSLVVISGCATPYSEAPIATNFKSSEQLKLQAASHWITITNNIADKLIQSLPQQKNQILYVISKDNSSFNESVRNELITSLVQHGYLVSKIPTNALNVTIGTQVVKFSRDSYGPQFAGVPTLLAAGAWSFSAAKVSVAGGATALVAAADAYTRFGSKYAAGEIPKTEIIVNVSVSNNQYYIARSTTAYYVSDTDAALYAESRVETKTFQVVGE